MKGTIGWHAAMSFYHAETSGSFGEGSELWAAEHAGYAYGHAFRAAELAYDMGMAHGRKTPNKHRDADRATHISAEIQKIGIVSGSVDDFNLKMREARDRFDESVVRLRLLMNSGSKP